MDRQHVAIRSVSRLRPYDIDEVLDAICWQVDDTADLVSLACVSRRFTTPCMRVLWESPVFDGAPVLGMIHLFPHDLFLLLRDGTDRELRIPPKAFERFDYYARFVRSLHVWHRSRESVVAFILTRSRPGRWLFPGLLDLHLGASGDVLETVPLYFSPTLHTVRLNHWSNHGLQELEPTPELRRALLTVCSLPALQKLDLADTLYTGVEDDPALVAGFTQLARTLSDARAQSFLTLPSIFAHLAGNTRLHTVYLNLTDGQAYHAPLRTIVPALRDSFPALRTLGLVCSVEHAVRVLRETIGAGRAYECLDLQIDSLVDVGRLGDITRCLCAADRPGGAELRSFRLTSTAVTALPLLPPPDPPERLAAALHPLTGSPHLRQLEIIITFSAAQMLGDAELAGLLRAWPDLRSLVLSCDTDPDDGALPMDSELGEWDATADAAPNARLTLLSLVAAARACPALERLMLPFLCTQPIPSLPPNPNPDRSLSERGVERAPLPHAHTLELVLLRSHVHNHALLPAFLRTLWRHAEVTCAGCAHFGRTTFRV